MMIATHILIGHDGSRNAETAFEDALDLAALARARLSVVSVASPPEPPTEVETQAAIELATPHYEALFDGLRRQAQERNVTLETHVLVGHPVDQILKAAARHDANMIVIGHLTHATCPVLVVRAC
jgi:nucleotide-binding universal stress UspA family protein